MIRSPFNHHLKRSRSQYRLYVIGDIHGHAEELDNILTKIDQDASQHPESEIEIALIGDFVNRGPNSKSVLERLYRLKQEKAGRAKITLLQGNHDIALLDFIKPTNPNLKYTSEFNFLAYGGLTTLASYGYFFENSKLENMDDFIESLKKWQIDEAKNFLAEQIPQEHKSMLENALHSYKYNPIGSDIGYFLCHGGVMDLVPLDEQLVDVLTGTDYQDEFSREFAKYKGHPLRDSDNKQWIVIHGHTIVGRDIKRSAGRISTDTGCYNGQYLSCVVLADGKYSKTISCPSYYREYDENLIPQNDNWPPSRVNPSITNDMLRRLGF